MIFLFCHFTCRSAQIFIEPVLLIVMNKTKDTGYLFAKMSSAEESGVGHIIIAGDASEAKAPIPPTRTYHFDETGPSDDKRPLRKWISDNVMLLVTLTGVVVGVVTGDLLDLFTQPQKAFVVCLTECERGM